MWWTIGKYVLKAVVVLWMTAVGGLLGANLLAIIGTLFFVPENTGVYVQPWSHAGWYVGAILFFVGAVTGRLRFINGTGLGSSSPRATQEATAGDGKETVQTNYEQPKEQTAPLKAVCFGGLVGGFLGLFLGANLLVFWFSLAYSPFAPKEVVSSVKVDLERRPGSGSKRPVMRSSHPISLYLGLIPAAVGSLAGATAAGVIALKYRGEAAS